MFNFLLGYNAPENNSPVVGQEVEQLLGSLQGGFKLFYIDGTEVTSKESFLQAVSKAMNFPDYFGNNWDAFEECITDLSWVGADTLLIFYKDVDSFAENSPGEFDVAISIFKSALKYWQEKNRLMHVFLTANNPTPRTYWLRDYVGFA